MTDHIVEANKKVIDLDALEKLTARIWSAVNDHRYPRFSDMESAAEALDALISELREARSENDRLQTAASLAEDDKMVMAHELREARGLLGPFAREAMEWSDDQPDRMTLDQHNIPSVTIGHCRAARAFLSKAQGGK
jgi:hypothetical protein